MSTHTEPLTEAELLQRNMARDLREIGQLCRYLRVEAWRRGGTNSAPGRGLPGGDAMNMLGPVATTAVWSHKLDALEAEHYRRLEAGARTRWPEIYEFGDDEQPPLQVLADWEDIVRKERDQPTGLRVTLDRSLAYLSKSVAWLAGESAITGLPNFEPADALAYDLARLRRRLEAILHSGPDDNTVPCIRCTGETRGRLHPIWGDAIDGEDDQWRCDSETCGALLTREDYRRALTAAHLLTATALSASQILQQYRVPMATVRKWAERGHVRKHRRDSSGRVTYDVDDVLAQQSKVWDGRIRTAEQAEAAAQQANSDADQSSIDSVG